LALPMMSRMNGSFFSRHGGERLVDGPYLESAS
jgi:hypothetical protein